ncbi:hypothetical protein ACE7GA_12665 [Roseomonas sp. CCTCC AB2023176]|uniref:hypothetical protein n=1 Tax=Roseomonas sp. CCTCC AB2023176 TaxID=3342640 RepID=UPI0035DAF9B2
MSIAFAAERRLLTEDELGPIQRSHYPMLETLSRDELQELVGWMRARRNRARDLVRDHRRARRGKAPQAAATPAPDADRGLDAKKQVFAGALKRVNSRLDALLAAERRRNNLARLHQALARRAAAPSRHPSAGATAHEEARSVPNGRSRPIIGGGRIGRTGQAVRHAQAARDARS